MMVRALRIAYTCALMVYMRIMERINTRIYEGAGSMHCVMYAICMHDVAVDAYICGYMRIIEVYMSIIEVYVSIIEVYMGIIHATWCNGRVVVCICTFCM